VKAGDMMRTIEDELTFCTIKNTTLSEK